MVADESTTEARLRLAARLGIGYYVETSLVLAELVGGDIIDASITFALLQANTAHLNVRGLELGDSAPPDAQRLPVSVHSLAMILNMPYETTRRRVMGLVERGWIMRRGGKGMIVPAEKLQSPRITQALERNFSNLRRLTKQLRDNGLE